MQRGQLRLCSSRPGRSLWETLKSPKALNPNPNLVLHSFCLSRPPGQASPTCGSTSRTVFRKTTLLHQSPLTIFDPSKCRNSCRKARQRNKLLTWRRNHRSSSLATSFSSLYHKVKGIISSSSIKILCLITSLKQSKKLTVAYLAMCRHLSRTWSQKVPRLNRCLSRLNSCCKHSTTVKPVPSTKPWTTKTPSNLLRSKPCSCCWTGA